MQNMEENIFTLTYNSQVQDDEFQYSDKEYLCSPNK